MSGRSGAALLRTSARSIIGRLVREPGFLAGMVVLTTIARGALAHPLAPALLELKEVDNGTVSVRWKTSVWKQSGVDLAPLLPPRCRALSPPRTRVDAASAVVTWTADCGQTGLVGAAIGVEGADRSETDTLLRLELADGRVLQAVLRGDRATYTVPGREARSGVMREYAVLGLHHILGGFDHLLFVFGLMLLVPERRALVKTVTAFTAGHSVTLSLAALGYTAFPAGAIEALIALTILALAIELAQPRPSLLRRYPWAMAFVFGLLHGLGFAGALQEVGLPSGEIPAALLAFNLGIETGQLLFIALVLGLRRLAAPLIAASPAYLARLPVYVMGSLAAYWMFERAAALFA